jgi:hypothetical protein
LQQKSKWRLAGYVAAGILGVVLVIGIVGLMLVLHTPPPPSIHTDPAAAQRLQQEFQQAQTAASSGSQRLVRADETELNSMLKEYLQANRTNASADGAWVIQDMRVNLVADRLQLYLLANFRGKDLAFVLDGKVRTLNGYLDLEPISGKIGSLPIPKASLKRAMEQMLATPEGRESARLPRNLRDLHVEDGKLVVIFR